MIQLPLFIRQELNVSDSHCNVLAASRHTCMNPNTSEEPSVLCIRRVCNSSAIRAGLSQGCMNHLGHHYINGYTVGSMIRAAIVVCGLQCCVRENLLKGWHTGRETGSLKPELMSIFDNTEPNDSVEWERE